MKLNTFDPHKKKIVKIGVIKDGILYKKVKPEHFFRLANAYGIQYDAFNEIINQVKKIVIMEQNGNNWESIPEDWFINGKVSDYGYGKQIFLSLKFMKLKKFKPNLDKVESPTMAMAKALENPRNKAIWEQTRLKLHK